MWLRPFPFQFVVSVLGPPWASLLFLCLVLFAAVVCKLWSWILALPTEEPAARPQARSEAPLGEGEILRPAAVDHPLHDPDLDG